MKIAITFLTLGLLLGCSSGDQAPKTDAVPAPQAVPSKAPDEKAALDALAKTNEAQSVYFKRNRRYALTFEELIESRDLKSEPTAAETGYTFRLRPAADAQTYSISAAPASSSSAARHLFTDQTGVIRAESDKDATAKSPAV